MNKCPAVAAILHAPFHNSDVIMGALASQITSLTVVYSIVYSDVDQRKHQIPASLAFVRGIHRTREFPAQIASYAENVSIWWRQHAGNLHRGRFVNDMADAVTVLLPWLPRWLSCLYAIWYWMYYPYSLGISVELLYQHGDNNPIAFVQTR